MIRFLVMGLMALAMAFPAGAALTDGEVFDELLSREWVTRDAKGVVNYVQFEKTSENLTGVATRTFFESLDYMGISSVYVPIQIPMMFSVRSGMIVISGNHYFVMGADGWIWRIDRDTQTIEPTPP